MKTHNINIIYKEYNFEEINDEDKLLIIAAKQATDNSYAPYSHFHVGCAIFLENGTIVKGSNMENASYPCGICAERAALSSANSNYPNITINTIAIAAEKDGKFTTEPLPPCGLCRQSLLEAEKRQNTPIRLILYGACHSFIINSITDLLPLHFDKKDLD